MDSGLTNTSPKPFQTRNDTQPISMEEYLTKTSKDKENKIPP